MPDENNNKRQDIEIAILKAELAAEKEAKKLAYNEMQRRLEGMNEFREQLRMQAGTFVTKAEINAVETRFNAEIKILQNKVDWILWIFILGTLVTIALNYIFK